jgi:DNA-binding NtrC family response regulator
MNMAIATDQIILLVAHPSAWLESATSHLSKDGYVVRQTTEIDQAVSLLRDDPSIDCAVLAEGLPREPWMAGLARMVMARSDVPVIVLAASYDPAAMAHYVQLGQQSSGDSLVSYNPNDYDYHRLSNLIHTILETRTPRHVGNSAGLGTREASWAHCWRQL